jgi:Serine dehydrogenase proteinase
MSDQIGPEACEKSDKSVEIVIPVGLTAARIQRANPAIGKEAAERLRVRRPERVGGMTEKNDLSPQRMALDAAEKELRGDIVIYRGLLDDEGCGKFIQATKNIKQEMALILVLETLGGDADSAYRIARYAQNFFEDFQIFVPGACKSAGTLLTLGASTIHMSPFGELGPLDVQVSKTDEFMEQRSGLFSKSALWSLTEEAFRTFERILLELKTRSGGTISFRTASQIAASMTNGLLGPIAEQLDPMAIGEDYQNLHITQEYGEKLIVAGSR